MSICIEKQGNILCWDTVMHWMGYDNEYKWENLQTLRYMMKEGYHRITMAAIFEDACERWTMSCDTKYILAWLRDPDYVFPEDSCFYGGSE